MRWIFFSVALATTLWAQANPAGRTASQRRPNQQQSLLRAEMRRSPAERIWCPHIDSAVAQAVSLEPAMRSFLLDATAAGLRKCNPRRVRAALVNSFSSTLEMIDNGQGTKSMLQTFALSDLLPIDETTVESLLFRAEPETRQELVARMISKAVAAKRFNRAVALLNQLPPQTAFPYAAAMELLQSLPPDHDVDIQAIFDRAMASDHEVHVIEIGGDDFGSMIVQFWNLVPASTVIRAIHQILDGADRKSEYDYRFFQLVPVLQKLDAADAQVILNTSRQAQTEPKAGVIDIQAPYPQSELSTPELPTSESVSGAPPQPPPRIAVEGDSTASILELGQIAKDSPRQATAAATTLPISAPSPNGGQGALHPRAEALVAIAHIMMKKDPSAAKDCVEEMLKALEDIDPSGGWTGPRDYWTKAMDIAEELRDIDLADKILRDGLVYAEKLEKQDEDRDDPNKALKAWWPSTSMRTRLLAAVSRVSLQLAIEATQRISDPVVQLLCKVALANDRLGAPITRSIVEVQTKSVAWTANWSE